MSNYEIVPAESVEWGGRRNGSLTAAFRQLKPGDALKLPKERRKVAHRLAGQAGILVQTTIVGEFCYVRLRPEEAQP